MILGIQGLRAVAVLLVVLDHIGYQIGRIDSTHSSRFGFGANGVDIFFVISGFIIWVTSQNVELTPLRFFARRIIRIVPLYWVVTSAIVVVALLAPRLVSSTKITITHTVLSFLFVPYPHPIIHDLRPVPVLIPGWSLNYEMFFYLIFGCLLVLKRRVLALTGALLFLLSLVAFGRVLHPQQTQMAYYSAPIILEFGWGLIVGSLYTHVRHSARLSIVWVAIAGAVVAILVVSYLQIVNNDNRMIAIGIPAALVVWGLATLKKLGRDLRYGLVWVGDASYSIYLTHVIALPAVSKGWSALHMGVEGWQAFSFVSIGMLASIFVGYVTFRFLETPVIDKLRIYLTSDRPQPVGVIADSSNL